MMAGNSITLRVLSPLRILNRTSARKILPVFAVIIFCNAFAAWYVLGERIIYHFDSIGYWAMLVELKHNLATQPWNALQWFWSGIRMDDYSSLTIAPLLPFSLFGTTRLWYVLSIVNTFALPAVFAFLLLSRRFFALAHPSFPGVPPPPQTLQTAAILVTILCAPPFWAAIVGGMPDVAGIALISTILLLTLQSLPALRWRDESIVGILAFILIRFRRWYIIWVVGYLLARGVMLLLLCAWRRQWKPLMIQSAKLALCGGVCAALLFLVSGPFILRVIGSDYASLYAGFQIPDFTWWKAIHTVISRFGYILTIFAIGGVILSFAHPRLRIPGAFLLIQFVTTFALFARTQTFFSHHWYLLLTTVLLFAGFFLLEHIHHAARTRTIAVGFLVLNVFIFFAVFFPPLSKLTYPIIPLIPNYPFLIRTRGDLNEMKHLQWSLFDEMRNPTDRVYVLSASTILNRAMVHYMHFTFPELPNLSGKVLDTQDLDRWYGFPSQFFQASHIVVVEPIQYMNTPENSRILILPAERLLNRQGLGQAFRRLPYQFRLDGGSTASIFRRTQKITKAEALEFSDALRAYYPEDPKIYEISIPPGILADE
ncbi:MAG: hypothetical protein PHX93_02710 [Candidatus Peribacteraceae bacterium]|jgi:hypothetical protein|nr:hypothetical protein [Candidatus Peribacteraceae bacterium]